MEKKTMTIVAVVAVVIIIAAAACVFLLPAKNYNAQELAEKFVKDYDGEFGDFEVAIGGTADLAILSYTTHTKLPATGEELDKTRSSNIKVIHFETKDAATAAYDNYIKIHDAPYESTNGSSGETIYSQLKPVGMASDFVTVLNGTKNIELYSIDGVSVKNVKASDYGCDQIYVLYGAYHPTKSTSAAFTLAMGVIQDGNNLIVFNQSTSDKFGLYLNVAIYEDDIVGILAKISQADYEKELTKLIKAF